MIDYLEKIRVRTKQPIHLDMDKLDVFCELVLNYGINKTITLSNMRNLRDLLAVVDSGTFIRNDAKTARFRFLTSYLDTVVTEGISASKICITRAHSVLEQKYWKIIHREVLQSIKPGELSEEDARYINRMVFQDLNVSFIYAYQTAFLKMFSDLDIAKPNRDPSVYTAATTLVKSLAVELEAAERRSLNDESFDTTEPDSFTSTLKEDIKKATSTDEYLKTGMQGFNDMLGGGLYNGKAYNFIGVTGGGKSVLACNIVKQVMLCNRGRSFKDPTKIPIVLFISRENRRDETNERFFGVFASPENIKNYTVDDAVGLMVDGGLRPWQPGDIALKFMYRKNESMSVDDIEAEITSLSSQGKEVILVVDDYIDRVKAPDQRKERHRQTEDISNLEHDLAKKFNIPFVTFSQFNRAGTGLVDEMRANGKKDIALQMSGNYVATSFNMLMNFDVNIFILFEYDVDEKRWYMSFRKNKLRGNDTDCIDYFCQPFVGKNSRIQLMMDINSPEPLYRKTMVNEDTERVAKKAKAINKLTQQNINLTTITLSPEEDDTREFIGKAIMDIIKPKVYMKVFTERILPDGTREITFRLPHTEKFDEFIRLSEEYDAKENAAREDSDRPPWE